MSVVLTRSRALNALRAYASYALSWFSSVHFRSPFAIRHLPLFVSVEPANVCQLRCPECPVGQRTKDKGLKTEMPLMTREVFRRVLKEIQETAWVMQFYFQGEPLLNKDLPQMIREAHEAGLYTIVSTNGQAMTEDLAEELVRAGLNRIIVSMDGLTDASYNAYRVGGSLEKTKMALQLLRKAKERLKGHTMIELQCLRLKTNEHEWKAFERSYRSLGADRLVFKTAQLYDYANGHPLMPSQAKYSRYIKGSDGLYHRRKLGKGCWRVWSGVVVTTNGEVLPCCYDKAREYAYGNIMNTGMRELFAGEKANTFRQAAMQQTPLICQECWK